MRSRVVAVRFIKVLHTLGSIGLMGAVAVFVVLRAKNPAIATVGYADLCRSIDAIYRWLVVPSMIVCVFSGFASMIVHRPYWNALWAWVKGGTGIIVLNFTFRMQGVARSLTEPEAWGRPTEMAELLHTERIGLWILLVVSALNVIIGIWRPRFQRIVGGPKA